MTTITSSIVPRGGRGSPARVSVIKVADPGEPLEQEEERGQRDDSLEEVGLPPAQPFADLPGVPRLHRARVQDDSMPGKKKST